MIDNGATYVKDKAVSVLGAARSGMAVANLLARHGARVFVSEYGMLSDEKKGTLDKQGVRWEEGGHSGAAVQADFVVISPGVPSGTSIVKQITLAGRPVYSEIEVASWFCKAPIVAITGSNGKTTTTELLGHAFTLAGTTTWVCGNMGTPFSGLADQTSEVDVVVLEVSSFQLDYIESFRPKVSVLLNITPDHLDRYDYNIDLYAASKLRISKNQTDSDVLVFNMDDQGIRERMPITHSDAVPVRIVVV